MDFYCGGTGRRRGPKASPERVVTRSPSDSASTTRCTPKVAHEITAVANFIGDHGPAVPFRAKHLNVTGASFGLQVRKWELVAPGRGVRIHKLHERENYCNC